MASLPPECVEYLAKYDDLLRTSGVPAAERTNAVDSIRATFVQACEHEAARAALSEGLRTAIEQMDAAIRGLPPSSTTSPPPEREIKGDLDALAPEDRAFVSYWRSADRDVPFRDVHRFTRPDGPVVEMQIGRFYVRLIDGYEEILNPGSTGAITIRFWKTRDGFYFAQECGGCIALRNVLYGPFIAEGDGFEQPA